MQARRRQTKAALLVVALILALPAAGCADNQSAADDQPTNPATNAAQLRCAAAMGMPTHSGAFSEALSNCLGAASGQ